MFARNNKVLYFCISNILFRLNEQILQIESSYYQFEAHNRIPFQYSLHIEYTHRNGIVFLFKVNRI